MGVAARHGRVDGARRRLSRDDARRDQDAAPDTPWFLRGNFAPVDDEHTVTDLAVTGAIPPSLSGRYLRNGSNPKAGNPSHWFFGDGMVHGIRLEGGRAAWYRDRWVRTTKLEQGLDQMASVFDPTASAANTHVLAHAGRIWAPEEQHLPYELTPELDTVGPDDFDPLTGDPGALVKWDLQTRAKHVVDVGPGRFPGEFVFVPEHDGAGEDEGWVIGIAHDAATDRSDLVICDASSPDAAPVARVHLPRRVPYGFHGSWIDDRELASPWPRSDGTETTGSSVRSARSGTGSSTSAKHVADPTARPPRPPYARPVQSAPPPLDVLVVDDEPMVREVVARYLERDGVRVHEVADGDQALAWLAANHPALVVLDVMLPGVDGLSLLRRLRADGDVPVILLTARAEEVDRVVGLELGADDYVVKPFSPRELAVRVRNLLRRTARPAPDGAVLRFGSLTIDPSAREVSVDGDLVTLTPKEFDLLLVLARSPRQVFSRRELLQLVWDSAPEYQDPATVTVHVGRLRQKLETDPDHPRWIDTVWGVGYRFEP